MNLTNDKSALISAGVELYVSRVWLYVWSTVPSWKLLMVHIYVFLVQTVRKLKTQQDREFLLESSWNGQQSDSIWPDHQEHHLFYPFLSSVVGLNLLCLWKSSLFYFCTICTIFCQWRLWNSLVPIKETPGHMWKQMFLFQMTPNCFCYCALQDLLIRRLSGCLNKELTLHIKSWQRHSVTSLRQSPLISVAFEKPIWFHLIINEQKSFCCNATLPSELHLIHHLCSRTGRRRPCSHLHHFSSLQGTQK